MKSFVLGYNTNGLAHHDLIDAIGLLASIGYRGVAITIDHGTLHPYDDRTDDQLQQVASLLRKHNFRSVIETGARFLLDPETKHEPTLVSPDPLERARRIDFLCRAIDLAVPLKSDCVSLWSGIVHDGASESEAIGRLAEGLSEVLHYANSKNVLLGFEPEPGMLIDTLDRYGDLLETMESQNVDTSSLRLTIDIGHLHCQGEVPIAEKIHRWGERLVNVHIEDMRAGVHEHLRFGEGEIDFGPVIAALSKIGYDGPVNVELSRQSHEGPQAAQQAFDFLQRLLPHHLENRDSRA